jgi:hypothetical protein
MLKSLEEAKESCFVRKLRACVERVPKKRNFGGQRDGGFHCSSIGRGVVDHWRLLAGPDHWLTLCGALDIRIRLRIPARDLAMPKMRQSLWSLFGPLSPLPSTIMVARRIGLKFHAIIGK